MDAPQTLREFELEQRVKHLERELARLMGTAVPLLSGIPEYERASWENAVATLHQVASVERVYDPHYRRYHTVLECSNPPPNQMPGDPVNKWRSSYFIDLKTGTTDEQIARVTADMHRSLLHQLMYGYLGRKAA